jgi:short-subunit dehydrogenase
MTERKLALVTGASSGIGLELAKQCAEHDFDLIIVADEPEIESAAEAVRAIADVDVQAIRADLAAEDQIERVMESLGDRAVDLLCANAGRGIGKGFVEQDWPEIRDVIDTNITGTIYLTHRVARDMRDRGEGKILFTGSIAGFIPGTFQAVYNASKAFIDSFSIALRHELKDSGVTVTVLMPGATETRFFERADMLDTAVGQAEKDDPADVAEIGLKAALNGDEQVVSGWKNKLQVAASHVTPAGILAEQHRKMAQPGYGNRATSERDHTKNTRTLLISNTVLLGLAGMGMLLAYRNRKRIAEMLSPRLGHR